MRGGGGCQDNQSRAGGRASAWHPSVPSKRPSLLAVPSLQSWQSMPAHRQVPRLVTAAWLPAASMARPQRWAGEATCCEQKNSTTQHAQAPRPQPVASVPSQTPVSACGAATFRCGRQGGAVGAVSAGRWRRETLREARERRAALWRDVLTDVATFPSRMPSRLAHPGSACAPPWHWRGTPLYLLWRCEGRQRAAARDAAACGGALLTDQSVSAGAAPRDGFVSS